MKKLLIILAMVIPLTGCIPAALVLGATAGGAIIYDKRSFKTMAKDRQATQTAQNHVNEDPVLKDRAHIAVTSYDHIAVVAGQAPTPEMRERAYKIVAQTKGFKQVYNEITIAKPTNGAKQLSDAFITAKVKTAMIAKKGLHSTQLKVMTENHVVYLLGVVTREQADLAASVARRVKGVRKVVMAFQYV